MDLNREKAGEPRIMVTNYPPGKEVDFLVSGHCTISLPKAFQRPSKGLLKASVPWAAFPKSGTPGARPTGTKLQLAVRR